MQGFSQNDNQYHFSNSQRGQTPQSQYQPGARYFSSKNSENYNGSGQNFGNQFSRKPYSSQSNYQQQFNQNKQVSPTTLDQQYFDNLAEGKFDDAQIGYPMLKKNDPFQQQMNQNYNNQGLYNRNDESNIQNDKNYFDPFKQQKGKNNQNVRQSQNFQQPEYKRQISNLKSQKSDNSKQKKPLNSREQKLLNLKLFLALKNNQAIKEALRIRLQQEATRAVKTVMRAYRRFRCKQLRRAGYFLATIYLESNETIKPNQRVEIFGEFSEKSPWNVKLPMRFDSYFNCFKVDLKIRVGHKFKFVLDNGRKYFNSQRYEETNDGHGNINNVFNPRKIYWNKYERKKNRNYVGNLYDIALNYYRKLRIMREQEKIKQARELKAKQMKEREEFLKKQTIKTKIQGQTVVPLRDFDHTLSRQSFAEEKVQEIQRKIIPTSEQVSQIQEITRETEPQPIPISLIPKKEPKKTLTYTRSADIDQFLQVLDVKNKDQKTKNQNETHKDFKSQFEAFFRGEVIKGFSSPQQKLGAYEYNEENEYFQNLLISGAYLDTTVNTSFDSSKLNKNKKNSSQKFNLNLTPVVQKEVEFYKQFDNIFEITYEDQSSFGQTNKNCNEIQFSQLNLSSMTQRQSQKSQARKGLTQTPTSNHQKKMSSSTGVSNLVQSEKRSSLRKKNTSNIQKDLASLKRKTQSNYIINQKEKSKMAPATQNKKSQQKIEELQQVLVTKVDESVLDEQSFQKDEKLGNEIKLLNDQVSRQSDLISEKETIRLTNKSETPVNKIILSNEVELDQNENSSDQQKIILHQQASSDLHTQEHQLSTDHSLQQSNVSETNISKNESIKKIKIPEKTEIQTNGHKIEEQQPKVLSQTKIQDQAEDQKKVETIQKNDQKVEQSVQNIIQIKIEQTKQEIEINQQKEIDFVKPNKPVKHEIEQPQKKENISVKEELTHKIKNQKKVPEPEQQACMSEISFFAENQDEDDENETESVKHLPFILIHGAHRVGKAVDKCEDAYFISDRAFGVSDGVSGWNDYGFSSDQFSLQLMYLSKQVIEKCIKEAKQTNKSGKPSASQHTSAGIKRNRSLLSLDNLDIDDEQDDENESKEEGYDSSSSSKSVDSDKISSQKGDKEDSLNSKMDAKKKQVLSGFESDDQEIQNKDILEDKEVKKIQRTERTSKEKGSKKKKLTLEEEILKKETTEKVSQEQINNFMDNKLTLNMQLDTNRMNKVIYPTYVLGKAFAKVNAVGSATAMISILNKNELQIANIGDSGFLVIRFKNGEPYCPFKSKEQQHAFNIPYQLSQLPTQADLEILRKLGKREEVAKLKKVLKKKNNVCQDSPENADEYVVDLKDGDIIVSATDGVFDNLFQHEVLSIVKDYRKTQVPGLLSTEKQAIELAGILSEAAIDKFKNPKGKKTPYQRKYKKTYNATWEGGKEDDITVLITIARRVKTKQ